MNEIILKLVLLFTMFALTVLAGLSPMKVLHKLRHEAATAQSSSKHKHVSLVLCLLTCFSGGVFLATCFLHLFPELQENLETLDRVHDWRVDYPLGELLSCLGFFLIFFLEEVVILAIPAMAHGHSHHHHHHEHSHEPTPTTNNGLGEPVLQQPQQQLQPTSSSASSGGCCMVVETVLVDEHKHDNATETTALTSSKRPQSEEKEAPEGGQHCQTHCPLTVHERRGSNECTANATQNGRRISGNRFSYGSINNNSDWLSEQEEDDDPTAECTFAPIAFAEPERCEVNCETVDEDPPILMKSRPHAHSHGVRSVTFVLALGIHSIIEGLAFGVTSGQETIVALFVSLMVHKLIVAFSVGLQLFRTHAHQIKWVIISIFTLASMSPLGALIGLAVSSAAENAMWKDMTITILQGLAVGTFIYVTFFEVLLHERDNEHPNLLKLLVMFVGFALIGALRGIESSHGHSHAGHSNATDIFDDHGH